MRCSCGSKFIKTSEIFTYNSGKSSKQVQWKCTVGGCFFTGIKNCKFYDKFIFNISIIDEDMFITSAVFSKSLNDKKFFNLKIPVNKFVKTMVDNPNLSKTLIEMIQSYSMMT